MNFSPHVFALEPTFCHWKEFKEIRDFCWRSWIVSSHCAPQQSAFNSAGPIKGSLITSFALSETQSQNNDTGLDAVQGHYFWFYIERLIIQNKAQVTFENRSKGICFSFLAPLLLDNTCKICKKEMWTSQFMAGNELCSLEKKHLFPVCKTLGSCQFTLQTQESNLWSSAEGICINLGEILSTERVPFCHMFNTRRDRKHTLMHFHGAPAPANRKTVFKVF